MPTDVGAFDLGLFGKTMSALAKSIEPSQEEKDALKTVTRERILAGIANTASVGELPQSYTICMVSATNEYYDNLTCHFDYDDWKSLIEKCINRPQVVTLPVEPIFETRVFVTAFLLGFAVGMTVAFILK